MSAAAGLMRCAQHNVPKECRRITGPVQSLPADSTYHHSRTKSIILAGGSPLRSSVLSACVMALAECGAHASGGTAWYL